MAGVKNSFGLGGGSSKSRLVADLNDDYKKLNATLKETDKLSKSISNSLKNSGGRRGGGGASSMTEPSEPPEPGEPGGPGGRRSGGGGGGGSSSFSYSSAVKTMAGVALTALATGIDDQNYVANDIARRRFGFFSGVYSRQNDNIGTIAGAKAFASMSSRGTPVSPMDAANATMAGNSMGLMSGLKNYNTVINSTAGISNVMPGVGLEGGMGAVAALNQGASVNKLRMIGIQVRDQNGFMRGVEDIARDLWNSLNKNKSGMAKITESDLSYSLQPGNSIAMLLDQYFGTDAVLKQSIISYLFQFAKNNGAKVGAGYQSEAGKKELLTTGANPGITRSIGDRNTIGQANINAYTSAGVVGIQSANDTIMNFTKLTTAMAPLLQDLVTLTAFSTTLGGAGNGAGGILIKGVLDATKGAADVSLTGIKAIKYVAIAAAVALGTAGMMRNDLQQQDEYLADLIASGKADPNTKGTNSFGAKQDQILIDNPDLNAFLGDPTKYNLGGGGTNSTSTDGGDSGASVVAPKPKATAAQIKAAKLKKLRAGNSNLGADGYFNMKAESVSAKGWAKKFLNKGLGITATTENVAAIEEWLMHENTASSNFLGTRNNPLNTKWDMGKNLGTDYVGMTGYATEDEGIEAAATTLLNGEGFGYNHILKQLRSNGTEEQIYSAIAASDWSGKKSHYGAATGTGNFTNMAGATININIPNASNMDAKQLAEAIYDVINAQEQVDQARDTGT